ncbi:MAG: hypothetical protein RL701_2061 [Pseudomonadota bacterium]
MARVGKLLRVPSLERQPEADPAMMCPVRRDCSAVERNALPLFCGSDDWAEYRCNTRVAVHKFCRCCGIHIFYTPRSDPDKADVNARCCDGVNWAERAQRPCAAHDDVLLS